MGGDGDDERELLSSGRPWHWDGVLRGKKKRTQTLLNLSCGSLSWPWRSTTLTPTELHHFPQGDLFGGSQKPNWFGEVMRFIALRSLLLSKAISRYNRQGVVKSSSNSHSFLLLSVTSSPQVTIIGSWTWTLLLILDPRCKHMRCSFLQVSCCS